MNFTLIEISDIFIDHNTVQISPSDYIARVDKIQLIDSLLKPI